MAFTNEPVPNDEIKRQLARILASPRFRAAGNPAAFLNLVVARALESKKTTEEIIGKTLFGTDFSKTESTDVRVTAINLRKALNKYYTGEGAEDPILISLPQPPADIHIKLPRGEAYTPVFSYNPRNAVAQHYRFGLFSLKKAAPANIADAILLFAEVLQKQPNHVQANISMAEAFCLLAVFEFPSVLHMCQRNALLPPVRYAEIAVEQRPDDWYPHAALAAILMMAGFLDEARHHFQEALRLDCAHAQEYAWYHAFLFAIGDIDQGLDLVKACIEEDSLNAGPMALYSLWLYAARQFEASRDTLERVYDLEPNSWLADTVSLLLDMATGQDNDRVVFLPNARSVFGEWDEWDPFQEFSYAIRNVRAGEFDRAVHTLNNLWLYFRSPAIMWLHLMPVFDRMRDFKPFQELLDRRLSPPQLLELPMGQPCPAGVVEFPSGTRVSPWEYRSNRLTLRNLRAVPQGRQPYDTSA